MSVSVSMLEDWGSSGVLLMVNSSSFLNKRDLGYFIERELIVWL